jgi:exopolysaccharide production protein ExoZ
MSDPIEQNNKILSIQYLRGLAALGVVLFHYSASLPIYPFLKAIFNFGQTGVHVFFLISGFIIVYSLKKEKYKINQFFTFLLKRSIRIDPSYYVTVLLAFTLFWYLSIISPVKGTKFPFIPQQFLAHLFYIIPFTSYSFYIVVFWTLCVEFQFYLLIGLFYFISNKWFYKNFFLILFCLSSFITLPHAQFLVFTYSSIFATGISLVNLYQNRSWLNAILPILFLILVGYKFGLPIFILLGATCGVILFFKPSIKPLIFLGNISYSLYLTHALISEVLLRRVEIKYQLRVSSYSLFYLLFEIFIAVIISYFFYKVIEQPSLALSKRFIYKNRSNDNC